MTEPAPHDDPNLPAKPTPQRVFVSPAGEAASSSAANTSQAMMGALRIGAGTLAITVTRMMLMGVVLAVVAARIAGSVSGTAGCLAVLLTLGITLVMAFALAWQRAGLFALAEAVEGSGIASRALKSVYGKIIGDDNDQDEQGRIARTVGRTSRSEAEARLDGAIAAADPSLHAGGLLAGVFRHAQLLLMKAIRRISLEEFRRDDSAGGGVDLVKVRERIAERIGASAATAIRRRARWITIAYVSLTIVITLSVAWALRELFR